MHVYRMHVFTYTDVCIENACIYMHISCVEMHVFTYIEACMQKACVYIHRKIT